MTRKGDRNNMQLGVFGELLLMFGEFGAPEPNRR
jgi:hypothetical protein